MHNFVLLVQSERKFPKIARVNFPQPLPQVRDVVSAIRLLFRRSQDGLLDEDGCIGTKRQCYRVAGTDIYITARIPRLEIELGLVGGTIKLVDGHLDELGLERVENEFEKIVGERPLDLL